MPDRPPRVLIRAHDGSVCEGLNVTHLIPAEERTRFLQAAAREFRMPPLVDLVSLDDLDALE